MGKFKQFMINEDTGLGDLGLKVDKMFHSQWLGNAINGAFVTTDWNGTEQSPTLGYAGHALHMPDTDLTIPSTQRQGRIITLLIKKNPIYVRLSDGTEAHFTYDEWKKIEGQPQLGKTMTIIFQRHPEDFTNQHSRIDKVIVTD